MTKAKFGIVLLIAMVIAILIYLAVWVIKLINYAEGAVKESESLRETLDSKTDEQSNIEKTDKAAPASQEVGKAGSSEEGA